MSLHLQWQTLVQKVQKLQGDSISKHMFARLELEGSHNTPGKKAWVKTSFEGKI